MALLSSVIQSGTRAAQPAATAVAAGVLYFVTDEGELERSTGSAWVQVAVNETGHDALDHTGLTGVGGGAGIIRQIARAESTVDDTTTAATLQNSSLSLAITPTAADSILLIEVFGTCIASRVAGTIAERLMNVAIYNSTDAVLITEQTRGRNLVATNSATASVSMGIALYGEYTVNSTAPRTFVLQYRTQTVTNVQARIAGSATGGVFMKITEIAP